MPPKLSHAFPRMNPYYQLGLSLFKFFGSAVFSVRVVHPERMIQAGPVIVAMNHQSYLDPPAAGIAASRDVYTLARETLFRTRAARFVFPRIHVLPLDRSGNDLSALKLAVRLLKEGKPLLMFPEGTRSHDGQLQRAQPGLGFILAKTQVPVVPMRVFGAFEAMPRTGKAFQASPVKVVIGEPMYFGKDELTGKSGELFQSLSDRVMEAIAALEDPGDRCYEW